MLLREKIFYSGYIPARKLRKTETHLRHGATFIHALRMNKNEQFRSVFGAFLVAK